VLSGLIFLACILCYLSAVDLEGWRRRRRLATSLVFFALALLSKSITMTLPLVLVLLDIYPLRRLEVSPRRWNRSAAGRVLLEKVPFLILGVAGAAVSYWSVAQHSFFTSTVQYPLLSRIAMALYSVCFYIGKTVLPVGLSPLYELPARVDIFEGQFAFATVAAILITVSLLALWRRWPAGGAAYVYYAIVLAPVGGLVHAGFQLAHDRYSYLSCLGFALLVGAIPALLGRARAQGTVAPRLTHLAAAAVVGWIVVLGALTWEQVRVWKSTESLWMHASQAEPECSICQNNVGAMLVNSGNSKAALIHLARTVELRPDREKAYGGIGLALIQLDRAAEAEPNLKRALGKDASDVGVLNNLGKALLRQGKFDEAMPYLRRALVLDNVNVMARANLGAALAGAGRLQEALEQFHRAVELDQFAPEARIGLVQAYLEAGELKEAGKHFTILRQLHPKLAAPFARHFAS
jgi:Flp pilus assembly protein TadD